MFHFLFSIVSPFLFVGLLLCPAHQAVLGKATRRDGGGESTSASGSCRCAPDRWEGTLRSTEREFHLGGEEEEVEEGRRALMAESGVEMHYDYKNQLFSTKELETGMKSIEDFKEGLKYTIDEEGSCRVTSTPERTMERMCIPGHAVLVDEFRLPVEVPVYVWKWTDLENVNYTRKTIVSKKFCFPISEETYHVTRKYVELVSYLYVNVNLGIRDASVFQPPASCRYDVAEKEEEDEEDGMMEDERHRRRLGRI